MNYIKLKSLFILATLTCCSLNSKEKFMESDNKKESIENAKQKSMGTPQGSFSYSALRFSSVCESLSASNLNGYHENEEGSFTNINSTIHTIPQTNSNQYSFEKLLEGFYLGAYTYSILGKNQFLLFLSCLIENDILSEVDEFCKQSTENKKLFDHTNSFYKAILYTDLLIKDKDREKGIKDFAKYFNKYVLNNIQNFNLRPNQYIIYLDRFIFAVEEYLEIMDESSNRNTKLVDRIITFKRFFDYAIMLLASEQTIDWCKNFEKISRNKKNFEELGVIGLYFIKLDQTFEIFGKKVSTYLNNKQNLELFYAYGDSKDYKETKISNEAMQKFCEEKNVNYKNIAHKLVSDIRFWKNIWYGALASFIEKTNPLNNTNILNILESSTKKQKSDSILLELSKLISHFIYSGEFADPSVFLGDFINNCIHETYNSIIDEDSKLTSSLYNKLLNCLILKFEKLTEEDWESLRKKVLNFPNNFNLKGTEVLLKQLAELSNNAAIKEKINILQQIVNVKLAKVNEEKKNTNKEKCTLAEILNDFTISWKNLIEKNIKVLSEKLSRSEKDKYVNAITTLGDDSFSYEAHMGSVYEKVAEVNPEEFEKCIVSNSSVESPLINFCVLCKESHFKNFMEWLNISANEVARKLLDSNSGILSSNIESQVHEISKKLISLYWRKRGESFMEFLAEKNILVNVFNNAIARCLDKPTEIEARNKNKIDLPKKSLASILELKNVFSQISTLLCSLIHTGSLVEEISDELKEFTNNENIYLQYKKILEELSKKESAESLFPRILLEMNSRVINFDAKEWERFRSEILNFSNDFCFCGAIDIVKTLIDLGKNDIPLERLNEFLEILQTKNKKNKISKKVATIAEIVGEQFLWKNLTTESTGEDGNVQNFLSRNKNEELLGKIQNQIALKYEVLPEQNNHETLKPSKPLNAKERRKFKRMEKIPEPNPINESSNDKEKKEARQQFSKIAIALYESTKIDFLNYLIDASRLNNKELFGKTHLSEAEKEIWENCIAEQTQYNCKYTSRLLGGIVSSLCDFQGHKIYYSYKSDFAFIFLSGLALDFDLSDKYFSEFNDEKMKKYVQEKLFKLKITTPTAIFATKNGWHLHILGDFNYKEACSIMIKMGCDKAYIQAYMHNSFLCNPCKELLENNKTYYSIRLSPKIHPKKEDGKGINLYAFLDPREIAEDYVFSFIKSYNGFDGDVENLLKKTAVDEILEGTKKLYSQNKFSLYYRQLMIMNIVRAACGSVFNQANIHFKNALGLVHNQWVNISPLYTDPRWLVDNFKNAMNAYLSGLINGKNEKNKKIENNTNIEWGNSKPKNIITRKGANIK